MPIKREKSGKAKKKQAAIDELEQLRRGMPAKDSVREVVDFVSPQGDRYQILKTTETDPYDSLKKPQKRRRTKP